MEAITTQVFEYDGKPLIEKIQIEVPFTKERVFQDEGCFLYMKDADITLHSANEKMDIKKKEAVLLKCDTYFLEFLGKQNSGNVEVIAVHLYPEVLKKLYIHELPKLIEKRDKPTNTKHIVDDAVIARFIDSLEFYFDNPSLVNQDLIELKIKELVLLLVQTRNVSSVVELIHDLYSPRVVKLKKVIELHKFSNLTLEELAKLNDMSLSTFKREFQKVYGISPSKYIMQERLVKAQELLKVSEIPVSDVAYEVGYNDPLYFTRLFKKQFGVSPSHYRTRIES
ncbi:helix-turn-helix transcriptional regulator [Flammeovirga agarivorans]|uniref:Helix-turn-helix transcriptional regulator n=1 Tax=Flammeovirga agarivorans TaxID=2726742 RepID=A0A7X8XVQ2_9BACT|nr:AraC family transcriptional regulator [Flammeovirga agarivorans]NLR91516.1 helix-turn-helix transcriptional regulator [Flammeovirga agarivorans]